MIGEDEGASSLTPAPRPGGVGEITALLGAWSAGSGEALTALVPRIYDDLRRLAAQHLRGERPGHTLQPTALLHETYLRLSTQQRTLWQSRGHFFAVAARMMRRILVDHARSRAADKRGGRAELVALDGEPAAITTHELARVDDALAELERLDPEQSRLVELRFFGGLTHEEMASLLGVSTPTVARRWRLARAWLYRYLHGEC